MTAVRVLASRLTALFHKRRHDTELTEEIQAHLDLLTEEHQRLGMSAEHARAAARRAFGAVQQIIESYRDQRGGGSDGPVVVISYAFWQRHYGGAADAIGRTLALDNVPFTIIGVTPPEFFGADVGRTFDVVLPLGAEPLIRGRETFLDQRKRTWLTVMARLKAGQTIDSAIAGLVAVQPQIREATLPPNWSNQALATYQVGASLTQERVVAMLSGFFGGLALLLAGLGLYGVTSYTVSRRRAEIGIRIALGAPPHRVVRVVLSRVFILVALGVLIGSAASLWASRFVAALLYDLEPNDPATLIGAATILAVVGAVAGYLPARRVSRIDPMVALRCE